MEEEKITSITQLRPKDKLCTLTKDKSTQKLENLKIKILFWTLTTK